MSRRSRGITFLELLASSLVFAVAAGAAFRAALVCMTMIEDARDISLAGQVARAELEKHKAMGFWNVPLGSLAVGSGSPTGVWASGTAYVDRSGQPQPTASGVFSVDVWGSDHRVSPSVAGTSYSLNFSSYRDVLVRVKRQADGRVLAEMGTRMVRGGL